MPTGYTAAISKGITFDQYAWSCARAFGALVTMRDDPSDATIPEKFEPSDHHLKAISESTAERDMLREMTLDEADSRAEAAYREAVTERESRIAAKIDLQKKYNAMLAQIVRWKPPSDDHTGLKQFMIDQIRESIKFDCDTSYYEDNKPTRLSAEEFMARGIEAAEKSIQYHQENYAEEVARVASRNAWVSKLRDSLATV